MCSLLWARHCNESCLLYYLIRWYFLGNIIKQIFYKISDRLSGFPKVARLRLNPGLPVPSQDFPTSLVIDNEDFFSLFLYSFFLSLINDHCPPNPPPLFFLSTFPLKKFFGNVIYVLFSPRWKSERQINHKFQEIIKFLLLTTKDFKCWTYNYFYMLRSIIKHFQICILFQMLF